MKHIKYDKKRIKEILKKNGHTMINSSWYTNDDPRDASFTTYDKYGACFDWYINKEFKSVCKQRLSSLCINHKVNMYHYFEEYFEEEGNA